MVENDSSVRNFRWSFQRQAITSPLRVVVFKVLAIMVSLLLVGIVLWMSGYPVIDLSASIINSTLGSQFGIEQMLILATPIIITGAAVTIGGRMDIWNLGGEGQLLFGGWAATGIGLFLGNLGFALPIVIFLSAAISGAIFAFIPAVLRAKAGISEILTTILLNYVAVNWVTHFAKGPWRATDAVSIGSFRTDRVAYELPIILGKLHIGIIFAVIIVIVLAVMIRRTKWGYEIQSIGDNQKASQFAGMHVNKQMILVMLISGALCGLSGAIEVTGVMHRLTPTLSVFYAWNGLTVSILAGTSFIALIPYGIFMAILLNGGIVLKTAGLSHFVVYALTGLILILAAIGEIAANYRLIRIKGQTIPSDPNVQDH